MFQFYTRFTRSLHALLLVLLIAFGAQAQRVEITSLPVQPGKLADGYLFNIVSGFKISVGPESDVTLKDLVVSFTGTYLPEELAILGLSRMSKPMNNEMNYSNEDFIDRYPDVGPGTYTFLSNANRLLQAGRDYYFYFDLGLKNSNGANVGRNISVGLARLSDITFNNPAVTVTGSLTPPATFEIVKPEYIVTPITLPGVALPKYTNRPLPILGFKVEHAQPYKGYRYYDPTMNLTFSGIYTITGGSDLELNYFYKYGNPWNGNFSDFEDYWSYNYSFDKDLDVGSVGFDYDLYGASAPLYIYIGLRHTESYDIEAIRASINLGELNFTGVDEVVTSQTFSFKEIVPVVQALPAYNQPYTNYAGLGTYNPILTIKVDAPENSAAVFSQVGFILSSLGGNFNDYFNSGYFYMSNPLDAPQVVKSSKEFESIMNNSENSFISIGASSEVDYQFWFNYEYYIPAGKSKYFTIALNNSQLYQGSAQFQVLTVSSVNSYTDVTIPGTGSLITLQPTAYLASGSLASGTYAATAEIPVGEFTLSSPVLYSTGLAQLVVTLTGSLPLDEIEEIYLKVYGNGNEPYLPSFLNAYTIATIPYPSSPKLEFVVNQYDAYYSYLNPAVYYVVAKLKSDANVSVLGQTLGLKAISPNFITVQNDMLGTNLNYDATFSTTDIIHTLTGTTFSMQKVSGNEGGKLQLQNSSGSIYTLKVSANGNVPIERFMLSVTGTYTEDDVDEFYIYVSDDARFDNNDNYYTYVESASTGSGEVLEFVISQTIGQTETYIHIVPNVRSNAGKTVQVLGMTAQDLQIDSDLVTSINVNAGPGGMYTTDMINVTITARHFPNRLMPTYGNEFLTKYEVESDGAFYLENFYFSFLGQYNSDGYNTYYLVHTLEPGKATYNFDDYPGYLSDYNSSFYKMSIDDNPFDINVNPYFHIQKGKNYLNFVIQSSGYTNQTIALSALKANEMTIDGINMTFVNNTPSGTVTTRRLIPTLNALEISGNQLYRGAANQPVYGFKYRGNLNTYLSDIEYNLFTDFGHADYMGNPLGSLKYWINTVPGLVGAIDISDKVNGAIYKNLYIDSYELENYIFRLNADTDYYGYVTVDVSATASIGKFFQVYGEDPGNVNSYFEFNPLGVDSYDQTASNMTRGKRFTIVPEITPTLSLAAASLVAAGSSVNLNTLVSTDSDREVQYSISGSAAALSGSVLSPLSFGTVTVTASLPAVPGFNAVSTTRVFTVNRQTASIDLSDFSVIFQGTPFSVELSTLAGTNSNGTLSFSIQGSAATLNGSILAIHSAGVVTITATVAETAVFSEATKSATLTITDGSTSIFTSGEKGTFIYPNPANNSIQVAGGADFIDIYTLEGSTVYKGKGSTHNIASLKAGVYIVKVIKGSSYHIEKLVVKP